MNTSPEQGIFEAIRKDDRKAFEQVFRENYRPLKAFAFRYTNDLATSENIVQDVFLKLWQNRHHLEITSSLIYYLFRAVRNHSLNHLDKAKVRSGYLRMQHQIHS